MCLPDIAPFVHNGQYNGAVLFEGEEATMVQTFYNNHNYRLMACTQSLLSDSVYFEVSDFDGFLLYTSQGKAKPYWDFNVESTQQLKIRLVAPDQQTTSDIKQSGCVSILVGFRDPQTGMAKHSQ